MENTQVKTSTVSQKARNLLLNEIVKDKQFLSKLHDFVHSDMVKHVAEVMFMTDKSYSIAKGLSDPEISEGIADTKAGMVVDRIKEGCDAFELLKTHPEYKRVFSEEGNLVGFSKPAKIKAEASYLIEALGLACLYKAISPLSKVETRGLINAADWDAKIAIPYHCLVRLLNATSASGLMTDGTALHRDFLITEDLINEELRKTKNVQ